MAIITGNKQSVPPLHLSENAQLLPSAWSRTPAAQCHFFNPAITRFREQIILCYRIVTPDGQRRLALCRLTPDFQVVPASAVPFSDFIQNGGDWHADGRFCTFQDRLFVHYNDGALRGRRGTNQIYLVEVDPARLIPKGPARALRLVGPRQAVEKNWMLLCAIMAGSMPLPQLPLRTNVHPAHADSVAGPRGAAAAANGQPHGAAPGRLSVRTG